MDEENNPFTGPLLPLTLIAATAVLFLLAQLANIRLGTQGVTWQNERAEKLIKKLEEAQKSLDKNVEDNKALVAQSEQTQKHFTDVVRELNELASAGDKDAQLIIQGYGIKVGDPAPAEKKDEEKKPE